MASTPWGDVDLTNRGTLFSSLGAIPESMRQSAADYINATQPGHEPSPWLKAAVGAAFSYAGAQAFGGLGGPATAEAIGPASIAPSGGEFLGAGSSIAGGSMFDGLGSWIGTAKDILSGVSSAASAFRDVSSIAAPFVSYGATQDQLDAQYKIFQESKDFSSSEAQKAWERSMVGSGSQYQMAVKDLSAAGLNPMLAYRNGGASVSGSPAASAPSYPSLPSPGLNMVSTALQARGLEAQVRLAEAQATKAEQDAKTGSAVEAKTRVETTNLGTLGKQWAYQLDHIMPEQRGNIISSTLLNNASSNWNQQRYFHEFERIKLTKLEAAKAVQQLELLRNDVQWSDTMKSVPVVGVLVQALRAFAR